MVLHVMSGTFALQLFVDTCTARCQQSRSSGTTSDQQCMTYHTLARATGLASIGKAR